MYIKAMKWETLKERVARELYYIIKEGADYQELIQLDLTKSNFEVLRQLPEQMKHPEAIRKVYADKVWDTIMAWDIRQVYGLRKLFGRFFPKNLRVRELKINYGETGWEVFV